MNFSVGVLVHNPMAHLRMPLVERTLKSLRKAFPASSNRMVYDNHSTDGSCEWVRQAALREGFGRLGKLRQDNSTPGAGRLSMMRWIHDPERRHDESDPGIVVFSDDDMDWHSGAAKRLAEAWKHAPNDVAVISGLLEPNYAWNTPREAVRCGRERILVRDSCPGAAWTFRACDWPVIREHVAPDFGYDHKACVGLQKAGYRVAQMDLAEHIGWGYSTHGNEANEAPDARPLDREKWGV